METKLHV